MLRFMRKYATGYMVKGIFGLIIIVFIFWGVGGMRDDEKTVAEVGSHKISMHEYMETYNRLLTMYRNILKDRLDEKMLKTLKVREAAMNDIVDRYLLLQKAKETGITVSSEEFRNHLNGIDAFKRDGKFSKKAYQEVLKVNGLDAGRFEDSEKMGMIATKMANLIKDNGVALSDTQIWSSYIKDKGKVDLAYMAFDPSDYRNKVEVSDKETQDAYEKEKGAHVGENQYRLKYIVVDHGGPVKDDSVYMDLLKLKDIDKYGQEKGLKVMDLGLMKEGALFQRIGNLKPQEWLKGLKKGDISLPVRADSKSYIFQLADFEAGKPMDKTLVLKEIRERIAREKAKGMAKAEAENVIAKKAFSSKKDTGFLPRSSGTIPNIGTLPKGDMGVMALSKGHDLYEKPVDMGEKYYIFSFKDEKEPDKQEWEKDKGAYKQYLVRKNEDEFYRSFLTELRKMSKVKINWKEISVTESD